MPDTDPDSEPVSSEPVASMGPRHSLWEALMGYFIPAEALHSPALRYDGIRRLDEEDFSAEHGYEPGFEGRSEFEHGEFELWI